MWKVRVCFPSDRTRSQSKIGLHVLGIQQTSSTIDDTRVGDRHPSGEKSDRPRTSNSTTCTTTRPHNDIYRPQSNNIEASGAVSIGSRSYEARHGSNARRGHGQSSPPSLPGIQSNRTVHHSEESLNSGTDNIHPSSDIQLSVIAHIATRLNSEIVRLSPPLQAMANYLLRLMGARKEERLRWLEMHIPYLWVYMPPVSILC